MLTDYQKRKAERVREFEATKSIRSITCPACSGSGYYDHNGSPRCGCCGGSGKVRDRSRNISVQVIKGRYVVTELPTDA